MGVVAKENGAENEDKTEDMSCCGEGDGTAVVDADDGLK